MTTISEESSSSFRESKKRCFSFVRTDLPPLIGYTLGLSVRRGPRLKAQVIRRRRGHSAATPEDHGETECTECHSELADPVRSHGCCPPVPLFIPGHQTQGS